MAYRKRMSILTTDELINIFTRSERESSDCADSDSDVFSHNDGSEQDSENTSDSEETMIMPRPVLVRNQRKGKWNAGNRKERKGKKRRR
jgi:hypothetical protein